MNKKVTLSLLSATVFASMAASAFAAPTQGVYMGGSVDKFYKLDDLFNLSAAAKKQFVVDMNAANPDLDFKNLVFVDFDGKGAKFSEILAAGTLPKAKRDLTKADFEGSYVTVNLDGSNGASYDPRNDAVDVPTGDLKVESVSAINATKVQVKFGKPVDVVTGSNVANYGLYAVGGNTNMVLSVELNATKTVATLNLKTTDYLTNVPTNYTLKVDGVKDGQGNEISDFSAVYTLADTDRPTIGDVTFVDSKTISFTVSEPVAADDSTAAAGDINQFVGVYNASGVKVFGLDHMAGKARYNAATGKVTVDVSTLTAGTYTVKVANLKDKAGNLVTPNPVSKEFTVTNDTVAPEVTSIEPLGLKNDAGTLKGVLKVVFSEKIDPAATPDFVVEVDDVADAAATLTPESDGKTYTVTLSGPTTAGLHKIAIKTFKDLAQNPGATKAQFVTFAAQEPSATTAEYKTFATGNKVVVKFDRKVTQSVLANLTATYITSEHVEGSVTIDATALSVTDIDNDGQNELVIDADDYNGNGAGTLALPGGSYKVTLVAGLVADSADQTNASKEITFSIPESPTSTEVTIDSGTAPAQDALNMNIVKVKFTGKVDSATALNTNNYTIEGEKVFTKAVFTSAAKDEVRLTLADSAIKIDGDYTLAINGVKDANGNAVKAYSKPITLKENEKPFIAKAEITANNKVVVTFSEAIANNASVTEEDFVVKVNGTVVATTATTTAAGVTTITLTTPLTSATDVVTVTTDTDFDGEDAYGNVGVVGSTKTAEWKL